MNWTLCLLLLITETNFCSAVWWRSPEHSRYLLHLMLLDWGVPLQAQLSQGHVRPTVGNCTGFALQASREKPLPPGQIACLTQVSEILEGVPVEDLRILGPARLTHIRIPSLGISFRCLYQGELAEALCKHLCRDPVSGDLDWATWPTMAQHFSFLDCPQSPKSVGPCAAWGPWGAVIYFGLWLHCHSEQVRASLLCSVWLLVLPSTAFAPKSSTQFRTPPFMW